MHRPTAIEPVDYDFHRRRAAHWRRRTRRNLMRRLGTQLRRVLAAAFRAARSRRDAPAQRLRTA